MTNTSKNLKIALVISQFNSPITILMKEQALQAFKTIFASDDELTVYEVPGAVELPFMQQQVILNKNVDGILVMGCVIRGETDHYDYVCQMVSNGCMDVTLKHNVPMGFGLITAQNYALAKARCSSSHSKAKETVQALYDLIKTDQLLKESE
ncbi:MAG: 6,7-dimethyl-8-ribityllumazine synthase [Pseudomonadota bacterium]|nr:6,7-dimethyl-8-ribityllumazine synthase [Pseudomonadota bacterium]